MMKERPDRSSQEFQEAWAKKLEATPFGKIPIEAQGVSSRYRFLSEDAIDELAKRMRDIDSVLDPFGRADTGDFITSFYPEMSAALLTFYYDFSRFLNSFGGRVGLDEEERDSTIVEVFDFLSLPLSHDYHALSFDDPVALLADYKVMPESDWVIKSHATLRLYRHMERKRAQVADPARVRRAYLKYYQRRFPGYNDDFNAMPNLITYAKLHGLNTNFKIITHLVSQYLDSRGFAKAGREIETASSLEGVTEAATNIDLTEEIIKREKEYTARIKSASLEEKRQLSFYLKEFKDQRKFLQQLRQGIISYFESPYHYAEAIGRIVSRVQDFLVIGKDRKDQNVLLTLDGSWNPSLDRDPGAVSGDCTEGQPLPFDRPDVPIYNVKIFDPGSEHVGNIYLLVTHQHGRPDETIWHLDAIQTPKLEVDLDELIERVISGIGTKAAEKGAKYITVNWYPSKISNYDYVQDAVLRFWRKHGRKSVNLGLDHPFSGPRYSEPQADFKARVLWSDSRTKVAA